MKFSMKKLTKSVIGSSAFVLLTSCGLDLDSIINKNSAAGTEQDPYANYEFVDVGVSVSATNIEDGFGLTAMSCDVLIDGADSKSGYNPTGYNSETDGDDRIKVVKGDLLKLKLKQLKCSGIVYKPDFIVAGSDPVAYHGTNFTTWATGDTAVFTTSDGALKLNVKYISSCVADSGCGADFTLQLEASGFTLENYNNNTALDSTTYETSVGYIIAGAAAPAVSLKALAHRGFNNDYGRIKYSLAFECNSNIVVTTGNPGATPPTQDAATCAGININKFQVVLIDEANGWTTPTSSQIDAAITAATTPPGPTKQTLIPVGFPNKVGLNGDLGALSPNLGLSGTLAKGGFAVDNIETANSGYTKNIKYACVKFLDGQDKSYTCSKITFSFITQ
jgi:hypothetical protein